MGRGVARGWAWVAVLAMASGVARGDDVPAPFAPLEHLAGGWKGATLPKEGRQSFRGWTESHNWAWKFAKGVPVAMTVTMEGDKVLKRAILSYDAAGKQYRLDGTGADGKPIAFAGRFGPADKFLTLDRVGGPPEAKERLTIRLLPENKIRYMLWFDRKEPGAPQYSRVFEAGLTKEGEAFAAGGAAANLPKCVLTGGAGTMTVSYQGKTYYVCCTGCRDEFEADPERVLASARRKGRLDGDKPVSASSASAPSGKDDGAFDGLVDESAKPKSKEPPGPRPSRPAAAKAEAKEDKPASKPATVADPSAKAASLLRLGQSLEKAGKTSGALDYYRRVVKDFPKSKEAKAAAGRIKALEGK
jgi:YHS domain-containing protein